MSNKHLRSRFIILSLTVLYCFIIPSLNAQSNIDLLQGNADYPVPDPAAQIALGENPLSLLYPSTVRSLSISIASGWGKHRRITTAGAEFAPILIGNRIDQAEYLSGRLIRVLLRTRISFASEISPDKGFRGALGLRWMLHDDADIRADSTFQKQLIEWAGKISGLESSCKYSSEYGTEEYYSCLAKSVSSRPDMRRRIDSLRNNLKNKFWNKSVFEIALAAVYKSSGSQEGNSTGLLVQSYHGFMNLAFPMMDLNGQIVFGASGWLGHSDYLQSYQHQGVLITQFCYGNVSERFFCETKFAGADKFLPDWSLGLGVMMNIANGFWIKSGIASSLLQRSLIGTEAFIRFSFGTPEIR